MSKEKTSRFLRRRAVGAAATVLTLAAGIAEAHTPYLLPNVFSTTERDHVTLQSSFTEEFFVPDIVMKSDDFHVVGPNGSKAPLTAVTYFKDLGIIEAALPDPGTYRFSTGVRTGRKAKVAKVDGEWRMVDERPGAKAPPAGSPAGEMQSITRTDVYVTRGAPSPAALKPTGSGLEIHPVTHPSELDLESGFTVELLLDGKPLAGQTLSLHGGGEGHGDKPVAEVTTDARGRAEFGFKAPGPHLVMTRHRTETKAGAGTDISSFTYALTFEVGR